MSLLLNRMTIKTTLLQLLAALLFMGFIPHVQADESLAAAMELEHLRLRMLESFDRIHDYRVQMKVDINMPGMRIRDKRIRLDFQQPDSFRYKARGFALLPRRTVNMSPRNLFDGLARPRILAAPDSLPHTVRLIGNYREFGDVAEVEFLIDSLRWVPVRFEILLDGKTAMEMHTQYIEAAPGQWLPEESSLHMQLDADLQEFYEKLKMPMRRRKKLQQGLGTIQIVYGKYTFKE